MFVWQVAELKGITFEMVNQVLMVDYTTEDAERFWNSKWSDVQNTWLFYKPIYDLFWNRRRSVPHFSAEADYFYDVIGC